MYLFLHKEDIPRKSWTIYIPTFDRNAFVLFFHPILTASQIKRNAKHQGLKEEFLFDGDEMHLIDWFLSISAR